MIESENGPPLTANACVTQNVRVCVSSAHGAETTHSQTSHLRGVACASPYASRSHCRAASHSERGYDSGRGVCGDECGNAQVTVCHQSAASETEMVCVSVNATSCAGNAVGTVSPHACVRARDCRRHICDVRVAVCLCMSVRQRRPHPDAVACGGAVQHACVCAESPCGSLRLRRLWWSRMVGGRCRERDVTLESHEWWSTVWTAACLRVSAPTAV